MGRSSGNYQDDNSNKYRHHGHHQSHHHSHRQHQNHPSSSGRQQSGSFNPIEPFPSFHHHQLISPQLYSNPQPPFLQPLQPPPHMFGFDHMSGLNQMQTINLDQSLSTPNWSASFESTIPHMPAIPFPRPPLINQIGQQRPQAPMACNDPLQAFPPGQITEAGIIPTSPYYELPAGIMISLIKASSKESYVSIDPEDLRLPLPKFPDESFLRAIDSFYGTDGKQRDTDGWDSEFLDKIKLDKI